MNATADTTTRDSLPVAEGPAGNAWPRLTPYYLPCPRCGQVASHIEHWPRGQRLMRHVQQFYRPCPVHPLLSDEDRRAIAEDVRIGADQVTASSRGAIGGAR